MQIINLGEQKKVNVECDCGYNDTVNKEGLVDGMWICRECGKTIQLVGNINALDEEISYKEIELELDEEAM